MPLSTAYLALGSNVGERWAQMHSALELLEADGITIVRVSPVYQNRAIGMGDAGPFLNAVVEVQTTLDAEALLDVCLATENKLGRVRTGAWSPRTIDVDVLVFGETRIETARLQVPHPRIAERDFVLQPLADLTPDLELFGETVKELLNKLPVIELERCDGCLFPSHA
jgi:2-amino-4-hydroxy-6-hydroxymethyldihydropteridine diphosphokinase